MTITVFLAGVTSTVDSFIADATTEVTHNFENDIATFPVGKSTISDHVYQKNPTLTIKGVVTNHPVTTYDSNIIGYEEDRAINAHKLLKKLRDDGSVFTILTEYDDFNYCVLQSYSASFTSEVGDALEFLITAVVVRPVSASTVTGVLSELLDADAKKTDNGSGQMSDEPTLRVKTTVQSVTENLTLQQLNLRRSLGQISDADYDKAVTNLYSEE